MKNTAKSMIIALVCMVLLASNAAACYATITATPTTSGYAPLNVHFVAATDIENPTYSWNFNDNTVGGSGHHLDHSFTTPGKTFNVKLTVSGRTRDHFWENWEPVTTTATCTITTLPLPVANFTVNKTSGLAPLTVQFTSTSTNATGLAWDFNGDGKTDATTSPYIYTYNTPGTYTITLNATNPGGPSTKTSQINVTTPVKAGFNSSADGLSVVFTDQSTGTPNSWAWNFGDNNTLNGKNSTEHTYAHSGTYQVTLNVTNANNSADSITKPVTVKAAAPIAKLDVNPTSGDIPLTVTLKDVSTGEVDSRVWNIDGVDIAATNATLPYKFETVGIHTVKLTVTGTSSSSASKNVTVMKPLVVDFITNKKTGQAPCDVQFTDKSTGNIASWLWTFQDGTKSTEQNPPHTFAVSAGYHVVLTVTDVYGRSATKDITIIVTEKPGAYQPKAKLTATPMSGEAPLKVEFKSKSLNTASILWDFGDNSIKSTEKKLTHTYNAPGTYTVTLTAINGSKTDIATATIIVTKTQLGVKINDIKASTTSGETPLKVYFTSNVSGKPTYFSWIFEKSVPQIIPGGSAGHVFTKVGTYDITLTVKDATGHSDSMTKKGFITVLPKQKPEE